jgi:gliding motility-associated-like protein
MLFQRVLLLLTISLFANNLFAQLDTAFWFVAPEVTQIHGDRPIVFRFSSLENASTITIDQPSNPTFPTQTINLGPNDSQTIDLTTWIDIIENKPADQILSYGFKISATEQITAYYEVTPTCNCNPDIFALKGRNALGLAFLTPFQNLLNNASYARSGFNIVATEDNTNITITPTQNIIGHLAGAPFTITLNRGQTYYGEATGTNANQHLGGTSIISNKPVAVTLSDDTAQGTPFGGCADLMGDQLIPISILGTEYIALKGYLNGPDRLYILATTDNTSIAIDGVNLGVINAGETYNEILINPTAYVQTSQPSYVLHMSGFGCEVGEAILPPLVCTGSNVVPFTRSTNEFFALNILVPAGAEAGFTLNGVTGIINQVDFNPVPGTSNSWMYAQLDMTNTILVSQASRIQNNVDKFHLGLVHGGASSGCRYGYFSDFAVLSYQINSSDQSFCSGDTLELSSNTLPGATYTWSGPNGFLSQGASVSIENLQISDGGQYIIDGNFPNACELLPDTINIEVVETPAAPIIFNNGPICMGDSGLFWNEINAPFSFQWFDEFNIEINNQNDTIGFLSNDNILIQLQSALGSCLSPISIDSIIVLAQPELNFDGDTEVCGQSIDLSCQIIPNNNDSITSIIWTNNTEQTIGSGENINISTSQNIPYSEEYYFLNVNTENNCFTQDSIQITFHPVPIINSSYEDLCNGNEVSILNNLSWNGNPTNNPSMNYLYNLGDGNIINNTNNALDYSYEGSGVYNVQVVVNSSAGCQDSNTIEVIVQDIPEALIEIEPECVMKANFNSILALGNFQINSQIWNTEGFDPVTASNFTQEFESSGNYNGTLNITGLNNCSFDFPYSFFIEQAVGIADLNIPNVITSNDDGINDLFIIDPLFEVCESYELEIYNRWGALVFQKTTDGTTFSGQNLNGDDLLPGIYFYKLKSENAEKHGFITLIR